MRVPRIDRLAATFAIARLLVQCLALEPYGYFRDELSGHNSYWLWGYGTPSEGPPVLLGGHREALEEAFDSVTLVTTFACRFRMPYENDKPIWVARGLRESWPVLWRDLRHYE